MDMQRTEEQKYTRIQLSFNLDRQSVGFLIELVLLEEPSDQARKARVRTETEPQQKYLQGWRGPKKERGPTFALRGTVAEISGSWPSSRQCRRLSRIESVESGYIQYIGAGINMERVERAYKWQSVKESGCTRLGSDSSGLLTLSFHALGGINGLVEAFTTRRGASFRAVGPRDIDAARRRIFEKLDQTESHHQPATQKGNFRFHSHITSWQTRTRSICTCAALHFALSAWTDDDELRVATLDLRASGDFLISGEKLNVAERATWNLQLHATSNFYLVYYEPDSLLPSCRS
ncbi:hypothetical protein C8R45DRAFT_1190860 [Mycena sanguinolenta]|nr:hypothetical protein C8R45DRAFT_1190860 [Mycena sanguinolenta]